MDTSSTFTPRACRWHKALPLILLLLFACMNSLLAQNSNITLTLTKTHNAPTPVPSGQAFTYTLAYGWSGGAPGTLVITDAVPVELDVISTLPSSTISGNNVTFQISGLTASAGAGTVQINVRFKPGVTCDGTRACNTAQIQVKGEDRKVASNTTCATATAQNKWTFEKALFAGCAVDNDVIFRITVINPSGGDIGGLNLTNVQLADVLPAGATVTSVTGNWTTFTQTGTNVTLAGGPTTLPVSPWNSWYIAYLHVTFPSPTFSQGQMVINTARVNFTTPCDQKQQRFTDTAAVTLCAANPSGSLWKGLSIGLYFPSNPYYYPSFSPGCCGTYTLSYSNNGNVPQPGFVMEDNLPPTLDLSAVNTNVPSGQTVTLDVFCWNGVTCSATPCTTVVYSTAGLQTLTGLPANVCKVRWSYSNPIAITANLTNYLDVCVRNASYAAPFPAVLPGQNILNIVTAQATNLTQISASHSKPVDSLRPNILATKLFMGSCGPSCSPLTAGPFVPGDVVRWRMAVTNVGNATASSCTITDALPAGLTYVGNPTYFYGPSNWMANQYNPPCCSLTVTVPSQIGGTITTPTVGATNLSWSFPVLPYRCDGTVDYLIIEFDVKIGDAPPMPPGQYNNTFTFAAGNLPTPVTSNIATLTVNAIAQLTLSKEIRPKTPNGTFSSSASVVAGSPIEYRLRLTNSGNLTLSNICLLDIMPHVGDITVLPGYAARNSQFDIPLAAAGSVVAPGGYTVGYNTSANTKNPSRTAVCGGFCGIVNPAPGVGVGTLTAGTFGTYASPTYSFTASGGSTVLAPGGTLDILVSGTVPQGATVGQSACNSFAVQATPVGTSTCLSTQSVPACVTVTQQPNSGCDRLWLEGRKTECCGYNVILSNALGAVASLQYNVLPTGNGNTPGGIIQSIQTSPCQPTSTVPANVMGSTSGILNFNTACTQNSPLQLNLEAASTTASGEICIEVIATIVNKDGTKKECRDTVCFKCDPAPKVRCDSMSVKPFPYPNLDLSGRTFTVYNMKSPVSPICSVKIMVTPLPSGPGVNGGGLYIDGVWKSWPYGTSVAYTQVLPVHGLPANNTVQFNLGIDYTIGWVGNVTVTAYHCDGDSCTMEYGPWKATKKDVVVVGTPIDIKDKLFAYRLEFPREKARGKNIRSIAIRHGEPVGSIVAVTGATFPCDGDEKCNDLFESIRTNDRVVMIDLRHPLENGVQGAEPNVTVVYTAASDRRPTVEIIYFDESGQELGHENVTVTPGGTAGISDPSGMTGPLSMLKAHPNPTNGLCDLSFTLPTASTVDLDVMDLMGRKVINVITGERIGAGEHRRGVDMSNLPNGSYMVALRVNGVPTVLRIELMR